MNADLYQFVSGTYFGEIQFIPLLRKMPGCTLLWSRANHGFSVGDVIGPVVQPFGGWES
jgi:hypothetical protein